MEELRKTIDALFEEHGPAEIAKALVERCRDESAIARGEGDKKRERNMSMFANDLSNAAEDFETA